MSLPAGTYFPFEVVYVDSGNEASRFGAYGWVILPSDDEGNIEEAQAAFAALVTKTDAITLGQRVRSRYWGETLYEYDQTLNGANRETKLLVQYKDATNGQRFTVTVPTLDPDIPVPVVNVNVKDAYRMDTPASITEFITAFEAFVKTPLDNHAVEVIGLKVVGRNI